MKKMIAIVLCLVLALSLISCGEKSTGAPPAAEFSTVEEALETIKAVKEAGGKMAYPDDDNLYDKEYICLLKEVPLPGFEQEAIMLVSQGIVAYYQNEKSRATFYWDKGYEQTEELTERYSLERFENTKFYFGESGNDIFIYWWENGDQFSLAYPADRNILPQDIIGHLEVEKYDIG